MRRCASSAFDTRDMYIYIRIVWKRALRYIISRGCICFSLRHSCAEIYVVDSGVSCVLVGQAKFRKSYGDAGIGTAATLGVVGVM